MIYGKFSLCFSAHEWMDTNPIEWISPCGMIGIIISRSFIAPPSFSPFPFEESKSLLPGCQLKAEVCRHTCCKVFTLMMNKHMNISKTYTQQIIKQLAGK